MKDIIIIGAGTAGLTAAIYGQRAGLSCTVFEKYAPGGQIVNSPSIENYPGMFGVSGYDYSMALFEQAQKLGAEVQFAEVQGVDFSGKTKKVVTSAGDFEAKAVIIANGAARRKIGCKGETEFEGRGVSYCATCDGNFFRGKTVAVVGGGESAFEETEYLSEICDKVYLIHRRDIFSAAKTAVDSVLKKKNVTVLTNSVIEEIKDAMKKAGALNAMMSGSGPTVFGIFDDKKVAKAAKETIKAMGIAKQVYLADVHNTRRN